MTLTLHYFDNIITIFMFTITNIIIWCIIIVGIIPLLGDSKLNLNQIYDSPATNLPMSDFALPQPIAQVDLKHSANVTAVVERGAILNCRVRGIGNRTVSLLVYNTNISICLSPFSHELINIMSMKQSLQVSLHL